MAKATDVVGVVLDGLKMVTSTDGHQSFDQNAITVLSVLRLFAKLVQNIPISVSTAAYHGGFF